VGNAFEKELIEKISNWQKEMAHKINALEEKLEQIVPKPNPKDSILIRGFYNAMNLKEKIEALKDKIEILEDKSDKRIDWFEFLEDKVKALEIFSKTVGVSFTSFGKRIEALEEKTIGITNENYLKRGIELSGVRNIVKEFLEVIKGGNTPSDLAFKQWLEMLEGNNNAYSL